MTIKKERNKVRHFIETKFLSGFVHHDKRKKQKGNRSQIRKRAINEYTGDSEKI